MGTKSKFSEAFSGPASASCMFPFRREDCEKENYTLLR